MGPRCANHVTPLYPQKLALTSPTGGGRSVGMVRSRTKATEFSLVFSIVPGAGEDVHIYIRWATRIFRRGGSHSETIYNLGLILDITSSRRKYNCTKTLFATASTYIQMQLHDS